MNPTPPHPTPQPHPVRTAADDLVSLTLTVNGDEATLDLPPRVTLADALRDHLGLTGTHLGCEHGVCGMCTVLVDGDAARACLLFACQLDGAEVVTVEGLGRPDALHPLQKAFTRNHALQCGFCTPGFLLSAYDLLDHEPEVAPEQLPQELSGVLCRCTGYRGIVDAVAEVAAEYPEGLPEPGNCGTGRMLGRVGGGGLRPARREEGDSEAAVTDAPAAIVLPDTEPTIAIEVAEQVAAEPAAVWAVLDDPQRLASCLPGAELTEELGSDRYAGRARVALGPVRLTFAGTAEVTERDADAHRLRVLAQGRDRGGGSVQAAMRLGVVPIDSGGSRLTAQADVYLSGRIAQFGRALAGDVSRHLFAGFATALAQEATGAPATRRPRRGVLALLLAALRDALRRMIGGRSR